MKLGKRAAFALAAGSFCLLYTIFAIKPLETEYQFNPEWKIDVANPSTTKLSDDEEILPFKLGQSMGYFTTDGKVAAFVSFPYKASITEGAYVSYTANNSNATVYSPDGKELYRLKIEGFPHLTENKTFVFQPGGTSFVMCDEKGNAKWNYAGISPVSAFNTSENAVAAGFADGTICEFDLEGNLLNKFAPTGSNYPGIHGIDVSDDGKYLAVISGMDKQRFLLCYVDGHNSKIVHHSYMDSSDPLQKIVKFSKDNSTILYNHGPHISILDVASRKQADIDIKGHAIRIIEDKNNFFVLSKMKNTYSVYIIEKFATLTGSFSFEAQNAFIEAKDGKLYVGRDTHISCIKITRE